MIQNSHNPPLFAEKNKEMIKNTQKQSLNLACNYFLPLLAKRSSKKKIKDFSHYPNPKLCQKSFIKKCNFPTLSGQENRK